jgi:hypothetical protein
MAPSPSTRRRISLPDDVHRLQRTLQRRVLRFFPRRGLLDDHTAAKTTKMAFGFPIPTDVFAQARWGAKTL